LTTILAAIGNWFLVRAARGRHGFVLLSSADGTTYVPQDQALNFLVTRRVARDPGFLAQLTQCTSAMRMGLVDQDTAAGIVLRAVQHRMAAVNAYAPVKFDTETNENLKQQVTLANEEFEPIHSGARGEDQEDPLDDP